MSEARRTDPVKIWFFIVLGLTAVASVVLTVVLVNGYHL